MKEAGATNCTPFKGGLPVNGRADLFPSSLQWKFEVRLHLGISVQCAKHRVQHTSSHGMEHSPEKLKGVVTNDMSIGVADVIDQILRGMRI